MFTFADRRSQHQFPGDISDDVVFILEDPIGSSVARLNTSGAFIDKEEYYPFGDSSLRTFSYKRYRYVGKERDQESGLYYYGARYYAAWTCKFISVDPLAADYPFYTPYNYAGNKPINKIDIDGMQEPGQKTAPKSGVNTTPIPKSASNTGVIPQTNPTKTNIDPGITEEAKQQAKNPGGTLGKKEDIGVSKEVSKTDDNWAVDLLKNIGVTLLRAGIWGLVKELASSPKLDDVQQFKIAYRLAEETKFENETYTKAVTFWAKRIDWKNVDQEKFKDVYLYRAMETKGGNWIPSDIIIGASNGRQLGARTPKSNPVADVKPDENDMIYPHFGNDPDDSPAGLSANLFPAATAEQMGRIKTEGAIGKISIKTLLSRGLLPTFDGHGDNPGHFSIQPGLGMKFGAYQTILNTLPWQVYQRK